MSAQVEFEPLDLVIVRGSGVLTRTDADAAKKEIVEIIKVYGRINILISIEAGFSNLDQFANWDDDHDDEYIQQHIKRMAIVGDLRWRDSALLFFLNGLLPFKMEFFKADQEAFARAWLG